MLQRIIVILLLMVVEISTVRECFYESKQNIEIEDIEDSNESEDISKEITLEKYLPETISFQFNFYYKLVNSLVCDGISANITNPFRVIVSPPPKR